MLGAFLHTCAVRASFGVPILLGWASRFTVCLLDGSGKHVIVRGSRDPVRVFEDVPNAYTPPMPPRTPFPINHDHIESCVAPTASPEAR